VKASHKEVRAVIDAYNEHGGVDTDRLEAIALDADRYRAALEAIASGESWNPRETAMFALGLSWPKRLEGEAGR
jgi:hypothetical protein